jgi:hypothetical protein
MAVVGRKLGAGANLMCHIDQLKSTLLWVRDVLNPGAREWYRVQQGQLQASSFILPGKFKRSNCNNVQRSTGRGLHHHARIASKRVFLFQIQCKYKACTRCHIRSLCVNGIMMLKHNPARSGLLSWRSPRVP